MGTHTATALDNSTDALGRRRRQTGGGTEYVSPAELARIRGVSVVTIWRERQRGSLPPPVRLSAGRIGWRRADVL
jgi:predicted DNA-binding transcriptional regulator AlpA